MSRRKTALLVALAMLVAGGTGFYYVSSRDHYDPSKYESRIADGLEGGGLKVGSRISFVLPDQFDVAHSIGPEIETLILTFSRRTGAQVREFLDDRRPDFLRTHNAIFVADISPLPVTLRNVSVLPRLRKNSYPIVLIYEDEMAREFSNPMQRNRITVTRLRSGTVQRVDYLLDKTELGNVFPEGH